MDSRETVPGLYFDNFRLERNGLFRLDQAGGAAPVSLGMRALDLLLLLARRPGEIVSKKAITDAVWHGAAIADNNITVQIAALRRTLDQGRTQGSCIQTVNGRGYRFIAPVTGSEIAGAATGPGLPLPDKPSLAVLPFQNMSGDPEQEYFADGMVEEITTEIARLPWLFVIARNSSFTYKGRAVDVPQVARRTRCSSTSSKARSAKPAIRIRIVGQLIDAATGAHIWADRFDGTLENIFELQVILWLPASPARSSRRTAARRNRAGISQAC